MSRIDTVLAALRDENKSALIPYVCAGDPTAAATSSLMHAMAASGADIIEIGVPFSDPMADGPVIQRAAERALEAGMTVEGVFDLVAEFRRTNEDTPVVLMGYLNPIEAMGYDQFAARARAVGIDGVLVVDLPPEEAEPLLAAFEREHLAPIFLLSPTTTPERVATIVRHAKGYVYYVSLKGVTGAANLDVAGVAAQVAMIREKTNLPVGVGFGISDPASARSIGEVADAVVVGSALVRRIEDAGDDHTRIDANVTELLGAMRAEMDRR